jgi:hypothetical protein
MANTVADFVDHVLPIVPYRQWVFTSSSVTSRNAAMTSLSTRCYSGLRGLMVTIPDAKKYLRCAEDIRLRRRTAYPTGPIQDGVTLAPMMLDHLAGLVIAGAPR